MDSCAALAAIPAVCFFISEADIVLAATSNTGLQPFDSTLRDIGADYAANFL
jgi:hypothetical protein